MGEIWESRRREGSGSKGARERVTWFFTKIGKREDGREEGEKRRGKK